MKSACEKIDCRSDERAFKCRRQVWCRRIVGERRGKRGTNVLSTGRERARHILSRGIAFFDSRRWALESRRIHSRLKKGERERGEEKGSRKTDRGERLRKQSQSNAIEIVGNSSSRIRSLDKGEREHRGGWEREKGKGRASENRCVPASDFEREDRRTKKRKVTKGWFTVEKDILSISCVDRELALNHVLRSFLREREEENDYYIHNTILTK